MQRGRQPRDSFFDLDHPFRSFPGFSGFPSLFGGRDPFDDPFFTRPFGSFGGRDPFGDPFRPVGSTVEPASDGGPTDDASNNTSDKGVVIEELDSDDEREFIARAASMANEEQYSDQRQRAVSWEPSVEHPDNGAEAKTSMVLNSRSDHSRAQRPQDQTLKFSMQTSKVTYGGVDGAYYTSSRTRSRGSDGVVLEESREADKSTGQATHRISKGINEKGHSVTRKLNADGKVDTMQTLHNLDEDDLASFEKSWKTNGRGHHPTWNNVHDTRLSEGNTSGSWTRPFMDHGMFRSDSSNSSTKKVVRINIE